jgi:hypothetical protein
MRRELAVASVATGMAILGGGLVMLRIGGLSAFRASIRGTLTLLAVLVFLSNLLWLPISAYFAAHPPRLWTALLVGALSPVVGCLLINPTDLGFGIVLFGKLFYILIPIGIAIGYLVRRVLMSAQLEPA